MSKIKPGIYSFFLFITSILALSSCEQEECCVLPPVGSGLHGNWEFVRVNYGFSNTTQTAAEVGYTERLEVDVTSSRLRRLRNEVQVENTKFSLSEQGETQVITFEDEQTYSYYTIFVENDKTMLSLYERSPIGAILADGGTYYYEKK